MGTLTNYRRTGKAPRCRAEVKVKNKLSDIRLVKELINTPELDPSLRRKLLETNHGRMTGCGKLGSYTARVSGLRTVNGQEWWWIRLEDGTDTFYHTSELTDVPRIKKTKKKTKTESHMKTKPITYKFENGVETTGTIEQLLKVAEALGEKLRPETIDSVPRGYYLSSSKGLVHVNSMTDFHIRRALVKRAKTYMDSIFDAADDNATFMKKFINLTDDTAIIDLFNELSERTVKG
jgi:hypothetical protein